MGIFRGKPNVEKLAAEKDVEGIIKALGDEDKDVRMDAAGALGKIGDKRAVDPLTAALEKDEDCDVRASAALALGIVGEGERVVVDPLIAALKKDKHWGVRASAAIALGPTAYSLGDLRDERIVESLIAALGDEHWGVQQNAATTLGLLTKMNLGTDQQRWLQWWKNKKL